EGSSYRSFRFKRFDRHDETELPNVTCGGKNFECARKIECTSSALFAVEFAQYPFPECANLWRVAAGPGIDQPISAAIVAKNVKGLDKLPGGDFYLMESGRKDADALPRNRCPPFNMLGAQAVLQIALQLRVFNPRRLEPDLPPRVARIDYLEPQQVGRLLYPANGRGQSRAQHGRETRLDELMRFQTRPFAETAPDRDVDIGRREIDHTVGRIEPDRK